MAIVLASKSPRRRQLMALVTPDFEVDEAGIDESAVTAFTPAELALKLAEAKSHAVFGRRRSDAVVACDTVVEVEGSVLGKPGGPDEAAAMLQALSGRRHLVHTGVSIRHANRFCLFTETTTVDFSPIPAEEIARYIQTDEPYDKAGGYGIQGWAARWAARIEGCYYNVMGLPVAALYHQMHSLGLLGGPGGLP